MLVPAPVFGTVGTGITIVGTNVERLHESPVIELNPAVELQPGIYV
jgi:hypothetical protein